jgi:hypothetical protein
MEFQQSGSNLRGGLKRLKSAALPPTSQLAPVGAASYKGGTCDPVLLVQHPPSHFECGNDSLGD